MKFELYDVVALTSPMPEEGLPEGARGTVLQVYEEDEKRAYLVEFCDAEGMTLALLTIHDGVLMASG